MRASKTYKPANFNCHVVPTIMEEVWPSSLSGSRRFLAYETHGTKIGSGDPKEFEELLHGESGPITSLEAVIEISHRDNTNTAWGYEPGLAILYHPGRLDVHLGRTDPQQAKEVFARIERLAQLSPLEGSAALTPRRRTVFIAHSFDDAGNTYAFELTRFLSLLGFAVAAGDAFSPESVSTKVKRRLAKQEIVVAIVSTPSPWLVQEASGASFLEKPLFLLIEEGVDFKPGVHGDLEYIRYRPGHVSETFVRMVEGLIELGYSFSGDCAREGVPPGVKFNVPPSLQQDFHD